MSTADDIIRSWFPRRGDLLGKAMWECIGFHMSAVADGVEPKAALYLALVLFHSKQVEALHASRGVLGMMGF